VDISADVSKINKSLGRWFLNIFEEDNGDSSASRVIAALIVVFALGWGTALLHTKHIIDADNIVKIIQSAAMFYGINKVAGIFNKKDS
jgi:hypothetical protein